MLQGRFDYSRKGRPYVDAITLFPRFKRARSNVMFTYRMKIGIIEDRQEARGLPSLLGRDILDRWEMTYCPTAGRLAFEVLSADDQLASPLTQLS